MCVFSRVFANASREEGDLARAGPAVRRWTLPVAKSEPGLVERAESSS